MSAVHEKKRAFQCDVCPKSFSMLSNLKKHVITVHEKKKMAKCDICNKAFSTKGNRDSHIKNKHTGDPSKSNDKTYFCKLCQKVVPYGHKTDFHKADGNGNFNCPKCGKEFDNFDNGWFAFLYLIFILFLWVAFCHSLAI